MNAYLVNIGARQLDVRVHDVREWPWSTLVCGTDETQTRSGFEAWFVQSHTSEEAGAPQILKIVSAPVLPELLTEDAALPIQWESIGADALAALEATESLTHELGYWLECDRVIPPASLNADPDRLRQLLPADLTESLNWDASKCAFFVLSILKLSSASAPAPALGDHSMAHPSEDDEENPDDQPTLDYATVFPELAQKELVVVVKARNAVVATWLWKRHAQGTPLARNPMRLDSWLGLMQGQEPA